jgi:hypothetical protein
MDNDGQQSLENQIKISTLCGVGHFLMVEKPEAFSIHLISILSA